MTGLVRALSLVCRPEKHRHKHRLRPQACSNSYASAPRRLGLTAPRCLLAVPWLYWAARRPGNLVALLRCEAA